jgi:holo-[acyl-carrier protein] synthase
MRRSIAGNEIGMGLDRGIGIDMLEISRIRKSALNPRFLSRVFGKSELALYRQRGSPASFLAAGFCAKEAFSKALGTGIRGFELKDVQLLRNGLGKPYLALSGKASELARGLAFEASVSHTKEHAIAIVTCYQKREDNHD